MTGAPGAGNAPEDAWAQLPGWSSGPEDGGDGGPQVESAHTADTADAGHRGSLDESATASGDASVWSPEAGGSVDAWSQLDGWSGGPGTDAGPAPNAYGAPRASAAPDHVGADGHAWAHGGAAHGADAPPQGGSAYAPHGGPVPGPQPQPDPPSPVPPTTGPKPIQRRPIYIAAAVVAVAVVAVAAGLIALLRPQIGGDVMDLVGGAPEGNPSPGASTDPSQQGTDPNAPAPEAGTDEASAPSNVTLEDDAYNVTLSWHDNTGGAAAHYVVGGPVGSTPSNLANAEAGTTTAQVSGLKPAQDYCFTVVAVISVDKIAKSEETCTDRGTAGQSTQDAA
ncbi:hypothetical protein CDO52_14000 [Nocardiopsis gilva YIM 90087]|uniref:Fibronectin type-III domain-containing protein n=1 Tax=Nocardiopsis gilva YIM 90087 TaxID=1235441 RepID=A0A223S6J2_9ACTN|nr:fibronectin type III domain-containing protein [Nocardiopsis gilva]ASU83746.1 hypothetical protein CDO52_14000 [Nocardiopsis gilva YIM 90087]